MKKIPLTKGKFALVDDEDFLKCSEKKWWVNESGGNGYVMRHTPMVNGKRTKLSMHQFIMNVPKGMEIDHINGNTLDNRKSNLRICTRSENAKNTTLFKNNTSGYKGVNFVKSRGKYRAVLQMNRKKIFGGFFEDPREAAIKYNEMAFKFFGDFARLNIIKR